MDLVRFTLAQHAERPHTPDCWYGRTAAGGGLVWLLNTADPRSAAAEALQEDAARIRWCVVVCHELRMVGGTTVSIRSSCGRVAEHDRGVLVVQRLHTAPEGERASSVIRKSSTRSQS